MSNAETTKYNLNEPKGAILQLALLSPCGLTFLEGSEIMTTIEHLEKQRKLARYLRKQPQITAICSRLKKLRDLGQTDKQIESVIMQMNLPLRMHCFITGNFSDLMALKY